MSQYEQLRHFADSWGLLFMTVIFVGVVVWTLWPGRRAEHDAAAAIPFRHEDKPAPSPAPAAFRSPEHASAPKSAPERDERHQAEDPRRMQL